MNPFSYSARIVGYHGVREVGDHRLKIYSLISPEHGHPPLPEPDKIVSLLLPGLPDPALEADHKVGFGIFHWANDGLYTLTNTWFDANMLRMKAFTVDSFSGGKPQMQSLDHLNIIACVWELEIYKYERDLWVRAVLARKPAELTDGILRDYLATGFQGYA